MAWSRTGCAVTASARDRRAAPQYHNTVNIQRGDRLHHTIHPAALVRGGAELRAVLGEVRPKGRIPLLAGERRVVDIEERRLVILVGYRR